jgi:predicted DNA-binding transcriptional regulator YafY
MAKRKPRRDGLEDTPASERLASAITQHIETHSLAIRYRAENGAISERVVTPLSLMRPITRTYYNVRGKVQTAHNDPDNRPWTLLAWCHDKEAARCFFLTRVLSVDPVDRIHVPIHKIVHAVANGQPANILRLREETTPKKARKFLERFEPSPF